jgi:hypothetical protein
MRRCILVLVLALFAFAPSLAHAAEKIYVRDPLTNKAHQRPKTVSFRDVDLTGLKWIHWGNLRAIGRGKANVLICDTSCADGHRVRGTVRLVLRKRVMDGNRRVYQCIDGTISGVPKAYSKISWGC